MEDLLQDFTRTVETAAARLHSLTDEQASVRREQGKWSAKEIVGHLIDSAANNHQRFVHAQLKEDLVFDGYEQERWVVVQAYEHKPWPQLVELWRLYNLHLAHVMRQAPEAERARPRREHNLHEIGWAPVSKDEPATLEQLMRDYVGHLENHLRQIFQDG